MRKDLTDITLVVDRSGSMDTIQKDAEGGINAFIEEQKKGVGDARLTLVQFDTEYDFVHQGLPIQEVPPFKLSPRGGTALLDAVGRAINETGARLAAMAELDRPKLVVFVIVTDGGENSSKEFTKAMVKEMVTHQTDVYKWHFIYLGANQDAFSEAGAMGLTASNIANYSGRKSPQAYAATAGKLNMMRGMTSNDAPEELVKTAGGWTDEERESME
jgi:Mg-chelatase subunit ChlD